MEQKNWSVVRKLLGYGRYATQGALQHLNEVHDLLRIWIDHWQPTLKLIGKEREVRRCASGTLWPGRPYRRGTKEVLREAEWSRPGEVIHLWIPLPRAPSPDYEAGTLSTGSGKLKN